MPLWDMTVYYPSLESAEFAADFEKMKSLISDSRAKIEAKDLNGFIATASELSELLNLLYTFVGCFATTNTRDEVALGWESKIEQELVGYRQTMTEFAAWVGTLDVEAEIANNPKAAEHAYLLRRAKHRASKLMSPAEEALAAELNPSGPSAWGRLHSAVTSQMEVTVEFGTGVETMPMSAVRNIAHDPDRSRRKAAYEAELAAWKTVEVPCAASMNSIKGAVGLLAKKRGWGEAIDEACFENALDRETLEAMMAAAQESFPDFRRYFHAKAKLLGVGKLEWYDMFAPVGASQKWPVDKGCDFVATNFDAYSQKMGDFARRSFRENWIDFPSRPGKVDGAYCAGTRADESRILMNYDATFGNVKTLAHELGHAYHNLCLSGRSPMLRETPSTLAETASIFCETIVKNAVLSQVSGDERLAILEAVIQAPAQTVVDITSRYMFESAVFAGRVERDLTAKEMCEIMLQAQKDTYGDGLASYHPYMWAMKPHYYSTYSFYNFPYMFGLLFSLGLYNLYRQDPNSFRSQYDDLLSSTGMADAAELGARFGFNTRSIEFWRGSLNVVRADIAEFEAMVG